MQIAQLNNIKMAWQVQYVKKWQSHTCINVWTRTMATYTVNPDWFSTLGSPNKFKDQTRKFSHCILHLSNECSLRKQPKFHTCTITCIPDLWNHVSRWKNDCRNSILMKHHYKDLGNTSDWLKISASNQKHCSVRLDKVNGNEYSI